VKTASSLAAIQTMYCYDMVFINHLLQGTLEMSYFPVHRELIRNVVAPLMTCIRYCYPKDLYKIYR